MCHRTVARGCGVDIRNNSRITSCGLSLNCANTRDALSFGGFDHVGLHFGASVGLVNGLDAHFSITCGCGAHGLHSSNVVRSFRTRAVLSPGFLTLVGTPFLGPCHRSRGNKIAAFISTTSSFTRKFKLGAS